MKNTVTNPWTDTVEIRLFADAGRYRDDLFVSVNGRRYVIKRGETVSVPRCVAEVIEQSEAQDNKTAELIEKLSGSQSVPGGAA